MRVKHLGVRVGVVGGDVSETLHVHCLTWRPVSQVRCQGQ